MRQGRRLLSIGTVHVSGWQRTALLPSATMRHLCVVLLGLGRSLRLTLRVGLRLLLQRQCLGLSSLDGLGDLRNSTQAVVLQRNCC